MIKDFNSKLAIKLLFHRYRTAEKKRYSTSVFQRTHGHLLVFFMCWYLVVTLLKNLFWPNLIKFKSGKFLLYKFYIYLKMIDHQAAMAEWLRREIRNLLGSPRAGSNPVRSGLSFSLALKKFS